MDTALGRIISFDETGMTVHIPAQEISVNKAILKKYKNVLVGLPDGRMISPEQQRKAHVLLAEIAEFVCGEHGNSEIQDMKAFTKYDFLTQQQNALCRKMFSLSNCDMTLAKEYISYLIDFIIKHEIPSSVSLLKSCEDIEKYVYSCLLHKKCAVCQKPAELHHFDAIGAGRDRTEVYQIGMRVISLCREHHTKAHTKGRNWLTQDLYLVPIPLTVELGKVYKLTRKNLG